MSPLVKKALFRIRKLKKPPLFGGGGNILFGKQARRALVAVLMVLMLLGIAYIGKLPIRMKLSEGDIAAEDIYTPFDFKYKAGIDEEKTARLRERALAKVLDIYSMESAPYDKARAKVNVFFAEIISIRGSYAELEGAAAEGLVKKLPASISTEALKALLDYPDLDALRKKTIDIIRDVLSGPIISDEAKDALISSGARTVIVHRRHDGKKDALAVEKLSAISDLRDIAAPALSKSGILKKKVRNAIYAVLSDWIEPNLVFDANATESAKKEAVASTVPAYKILKRSKGEIIIRKGQRVTRDHLVQLEKINASSAAEGISSQLWGVVVLIILLSFLMLLYLKHFEPKIYSEDKLLLLIGLLILMAVVFARIIISSPLPSYFIPVAFVSMLLTLLVNGSVAAIAVMAATIIVALITGAKFNIFLASMVGGISAICTIYRARGRSQIIRSGVYVGILKFIVICAIGIISNFEIRIFLKEGLWGIASGITAAAITMVFLPFFESLFKLTTDIKLLELSDLNHPLLKDMVMKASGTYHHSLVVGNLAEAACDSIGANSLLARVGAYYHDIGKTHKSEYFAENQRESSDMHTNLSPSMSSLIITNHVKDGVEMADKYKLGNAIKDILEQHHGTGLVTYFYHQALENASDAKTISEEGFRYPGPRPQTKESAAVMLADSVEAASRVLQNPTPPRLKELVRKIINNKFIDRQLDECDLSLKDINKISDSFVRVLMGIYHSRVEYPKTIANKHGNNNKQRTKKNRV